MIDIHLDAERHHTETADVRAWHLFNAEPIGPLIGLEEFRLAPSARLPRPDCEDAEILTLVREGGLAYEDSNGNSGVLLSGEVQRATGAHGIRHAMRNASRGLCTHVLRACFVPPRADVGRGFRQRRFSAAERNGKLLVIASPDERAGSLRVSADVVVLSSILDGGYHMVHEVGAERVVWLQIASGSVMLDGRLLQPGDAVMVAEVRSVAVTARTKTEVLLFDLPRPPDRSIKMVDRPSN